MILARKHFHLYFRFQVTRLLINDVFQSFAPGNFTVWFAWMNIWQTKYCISQLYTLLLLKWNKFTPTTAYFMQFEFTSKCKFRSNVFYILNGIARSLGRYTSESNHFQWNVSFFSVALHSCSLTVSSVPYFSAISMQVIWTVFWYQWL